MRRLIAALLAGSTLVPITADAQPLGPPAGQWVREVSASSDLIAAEGDDTWVADDTGLTRLDADGGVLSHTGSSGITYVALAPTDDGDLYLTASFQGSATLDGTALTGPLNGPPDDSIVARLGDDGHLLWATPLDATQFAGDLDDVPGGGAIVGGEDDYHGTAFVRAVSADGTLTWQTDLEVGSPHWGLGLEVAVDDSGEVSLSANHDGPPALGSGGTAITLGTPSGEPGHLVGRLAADGTPLWAHTLSASYTLRTQRSDGSCDGQLVIAGVFGGPLLLDGADLDPPVLGRDFDPSRPQDYVASFDPDGDLAWAQDVDAAFQDQQLEVDVDCNGTVHLAGETSTDLTLGPLGDRVVTSAMRGSDPDALALFGFDPDGSPAYALVHDEVLDQFGAVDVAVGDLGPRVLVMKGDASGFGPSVGPVTASRVSVVAFGPPGPGAAAAPTLGAAFRWARLPDHPGPITTLDGQHLAMGPGGQAALGGPAEFAGTITTAEGQHDLTDATAFFARVRPDGVLAWSRGIGPAVDDGSEHVGVRAVAAGTDGSMYVAGVFDRTLVLDGPGATTAATRTIPPDPHGFSTPGFLARYTADGHLAWVRTFRSPDPARVGDVQRVALAAAPDGRVVLGLHHEGPLRYGPGARQIVHLHENQSRTLLLELTPGGAVQWARTTHGGIVDLAIDGHGTIHEYGTFGVRARIGADVVHGPRQTTSWYLARRDAHGRVRRAERLLVLTDGDNNDDTWVFDLTVDRDGTTYVAAIAGEPARFLPDAGGPVLHGEGHPVVAALTPAGRLRWLRRFRSDGQLSVGDLAPDRRGGVVIAGSGRGTFSLAGQERHLGTGDLYLARLRRDGSARSLRDGNSGNEWAGAIGVYPDGDVLVSTVVSEWATYGANRPEEVNVEDRRDRLLLLRYLGNQL